MIIDIHGHYTTEPRALHDFRAAQLAGIEDPARRPKATDIGVSDAELVASVQPQLKFQRERGSDLTIFSPRAAGMAHHMGTQAVGLEWATVSNDLIHRICTLLPDNFVPVGQLPQFPGAPVENCLPELERLAGLGFVGVNLNPDPSGGYWKSPPLTDRYWYPIYEKLCEHELPAMIHVTSSCNPAVHHTGAHYLNGDTTAFMQLLQGDLFADFPTLKLVIPHGGGAVPFHWGRYRGLAQDMKKPLLADHLMKNVFFDSCVYHLPGIELLAKVISPDNILFASEMLGAVKGIDPQTGHHYDDTKRYFDQLGLSETDRRKIFEGNARRVYPRLDRRLAEKGIVMNDNAAAPLADIRRDFERVAPEIVRKAAGFAASILADVAGRRGTLDGRIAPLAPSMRVAGPAFTIEVRAGDNLMIHAAMAMARPGDVLVVDGKADRSCALMGSIMMNACRKLGLAGVILDGAVRDTEELRELGFPVYAVGANPNGPTKFVPGRINWPISCGGVAVSPGDLVVGDADGVVVVEREKAASLLEAAAKKVAEERARIADIVAGKNLKPKWLDGSLRAAGVLKDGETL